MNTILKFRNERKITQEEFARLVGVDRSTVTKWETGKCKPTADKLVKVADVLGCTVDELLREENGNDHGQEKVS